MYEFKEINDTEIFDEFVEENSSEFMQTSHWGKIKDTWGSHMFVIYDNDAIALSALVLERKLPAVGKIWYCPGGFVCDYRNAKLLDAFSIYMKKEMKKRNIAFFLTDPKFVWKLNGEETHENDDVIKNLKNSGYVYNTNRNNFTYEPPLTIRLHLKKEDGTQCTSKEITKRYEKSVARSVKVSKQRSLFVERHRYEDIEKDPQLYEDFISVMTDTSDRIGFVTRPHDYYLHFIKELAKWTDFDLIYYDYDEDHKTYESHLKRLEELNSKEPTNKQKQEIETIEAWIKAFKQREEEIVSEGKGRICVAGGITIYFGKIANSLFSGTRNIIRNNVRSSQFFNDMKINDSIDRNMDYYDFGGVTYDYFDENSELYGLYKFKKSFGSETVEYIGEYTLVNNSFKYSVYTEFMPWAKKNVYKVRKFFSGK